MSELLFNFIGFSLLGAVAIVLILGIYTLFKGGSTSKKYSNKLLLLRVCLLYTSPSPRARTRGRMPSAA